MSGIRTLLSVISDDQTGQAPLATALLIARTMGCHVEGFHVLIDAASAVPYVGEAMAGALIEEMVEAAEKDARERADRARAMFLGVCQAHKIPLDVTPPGDCTLNAAWHEAQGPEPEQVALRGRVADLLVLGQPGPRGAPPSLLTLNAALLESGRPVIVAPPQPPSSVGQRVAIAWNGSAEAARAVLGAMPFLVRADAVTLLIAADGDGQDNAPIRAAELERHLAWHGVDATTRFLEAASGGRTGEALLDACADAEADLLVMGAYTHSRLRQLILGGVTRHVLERATLPVLMSH
ncbi:universal stress protein [Pararhodospirillum photometricum]|nr:universal stress protein [Pararhodospirillum photometricum]